MVETSVIGSGIMGSAISGGKGEWVIGLGIELSGNKEEEGGFWSTL